MATAAVTSYVDAVAVLRLGDLSEYVAHVLCSVHLTAIRFSSLAIRCVAEEKASRCSRLSVLFLREFNLLK